MPQGISYIKSHLVHPDYFVSSNNDSMAIHQIMSVQQGIQIIGIKSKKRKIQNKCQQCKQRCDNMQYNITRLSGWHVRRGTE